MLKREIEILMLDGCTKSEAEKHLKNGTIIFIFEDLKEHFESYMKEWDIDKEKIPTYRKMIQEKIPVADWGIVEDGEKVYFIMYAL